MSLRVRIMVVIMLLKDGWFVACTPADTIIGAKDVPELIKVLEEMDAYAAIETGRFEQP